MSEREHRLFRAASMSVLNAYFHDDALVVNLFVGSEVVWKRG